MVTARVRYRYRLRVNKTQAALLQQVFNVNRAVWNRMLDEWERRWRTERAALGFADASSLLTAWRAEHDWMQTESRTTQQETLRDLYDAIGRFFARRAQRPAFKSKKRGYNTARWQKFRIDDRLHLRTSAGRIAVRVIWSRPLPSQPKMVTVYRDRAGRWWASFTCEVELENAPVTGRTTGIDVGLTVFATTEHPETDVPNPRHARAAAKALARSQRNMARKQPGSRHREQAKRRTARVAARVADQRRDFHMKSARNLALTYDAVGVEKLRVANMRRRGRHKRGLNRSIADAGWAQFFRALEWQCRKHGRTFVQIEPAGTTQTCSECGAIAKQRLGLADRVYACDSCGYVADRDRNAARNLNPNRRARTGVGDDGSKTKAPTGAAAA